MTKGTAIGGYAVGPDDTVYLSVQTAKSSYSLISFDPKAGKISSRWRSRPDGSPLRRRLAVAAGPEGHDARQLSVTRFDATTLTEQATIPLPCAGVTGPLIASDGTAIWFENTTNYHPATKKARSGTPRPVDQQAGHDRGDAFRGRLSIDSQGAVFYEDTNTVPTTF